MGRRILKAQAQTVLFQSANRFLSIIVQYFIAEIVLQEGGHGAIIAQCLLFDC